MAGTNGDTPAAHILGGMLRQARENSGIKYHDLAARLGVHSSMLGHWMGGRRVLSEKDLGTFLGIVGVTGSAQDEFFELARRAADPNWIAPGVDKQLAVLMEYERTATAITEVNPLLVPGLLQTADYARTIMLRSGATSGEADHRVTNRMGRRDVLERGSPPSAQFSGLIGEHALRYPPCEASIMAEQLQHLLTWGNRSNITVQVIPINTPWTPMHSGPFVALEFAASRPVVHLEHYRSGATLTDARDVRDYVAAADTVRRMAMSPEETAGLIARLLDENGDST